MPFKDFVNRDLGTFINVDEFSEFHNIDGVDIPALIDSDVLKERPRQPIELYHSANGVYVSSIVLYVRETDLGFRPVILQHMKVDGTLYTVSNCTESMGLLEIVLEANEA
jgi:hypothetical protein